MKKEVIYDEVFDAQQQFRIILDSMARPGKLGQMPDLNITPPRGINKASAMVGFALLNADVTFYVSGNNRDEIAFYITLNTAAQQAEIDKADFVFINGLQGADIIFDAKTGTLSYPEDSATFIITTDTIIEDCDESEVSVTLKGPGIQTTKQAGIAGINPEILDAVKEQNLEFPLGIDLIITDIYNRVLCIPRSSRFSVKLKEAALD